jgi:hypothetical protein
MAERCDQCLFSKDKIVSDTRMRQVLAECERKDQHFTCHKATLCDEDACCRAFYDRDPMRTNLMRIAARLGVVRFVTMEPDA